MDAKKPALITRIEKAIDVVIGERDDRYFASESCVTARLFEQLGALDEGRSYRMMEPHLKGNLKKGAGKIKSTQPDLYLYDGFAGNGCFVEVKLQPTWSDPNGRRTGTAKRPYWERGMDQLGKLEGEVSKGKWFTKQWCWTTPPPRPTWDNLHFVLLCFGRTADLRGLDETADSSWKPTGKGGKAIVWPKRGTPWVGRCDIDRVMPPEILPCHEPAWDSWD